MEILTCPERERLVMDKMYIKENIAHEKHTGKQYCSCTINHWVHQIRSTFEENGESDMPTLATVMLVLFVKGLYSSEKFFYVCIDHLWMIMRGKL